MPNNVVKKGDIVLKEKQKDKSRKSGKLASQYFECTYSVVDIHPNAKLILKNTDTNEILKTPVPPSHVKKYLKRKLQDEFEDTQDPEVNIEVEMEDYLDIMSSHCRGFHAQRTVLIYPMRVSTTWGFPGILPRYHNGTNSNLPCQLNHPYV